MVDSVPPDRLTDQERKPIAKAPVVLCEDAAHFADTPYVTEGKGKDQTPNRSSRIPTKSRASRQKREPSRCESGPVTG